MILQVLSDLCLCTHVRTCVCGMHAVADCFHETGLENGTLGTVPTAKLPILGFNIIHQEGKRAYGHKAPELKACTQASTPYKQLLHSNKPIILQRRNELKNNTHHLRIKSRAFHLKVPCSFNQMLFYSTCCSAQLVL